MSQPTDSDWQAGAAEDWAVARELVEGGRLRHGLFFAHLALEKLLKAAVFRSGNDVPRVHNLTRLAVSSGLPLSQAHKDVLAEMNQFSVESRYPTPSVPAIGADEASGYIARAEEVFEWLTGQL